MQGIDRVNFTKTVDNTMFIVILRLNWGKIKLYHSIYEKSMFLAKKKVCDLCHDLTVSLIKINI